PRAPARWTSRHRGSTTSVSTRIPVSGSVLVVDLAAVGAQDPEDRRGVAAAVPARALVVRFRARARAVSGQREGAFRLYGHQAHRDVEGRAAGVRRAGPLGCGLRVPVG